MRRTLTLLTAMLFTVSLVAGPSLADQRGGPGQGEGQGQGQGQGQGKGQGLENPNVVEFTSRGHEFFGLPEEIPAGWTTFRYHNNSDGEHLAYLAELPKVDGVQMTSADSVDEVAPVFQDAMNLIADGEFGAGFAEFGNLPAWYGQVIPTGGPGLVAPGEVAETTVHLEPGHYQLECYVKSLNKDTGYHEFHTFTMIEDLVVTNEQGGANEPVADVTVDLSEDGIEIDGDIRPGHRTFEINLDDKTLVSEEPHGNLLGNSVHIARLDQGSDEDTLKELDGWMNWVNPEGLSVTPPATFLGGVNSMLPGSTAYVSVHLTPGEYAIVSEVDGPLGKDMLVTVSVP